MRNPEIALCSLSRRRVAADRIDLAAPKLECHEGAIDRQCGAECAVMSGGDRSRRREAALCSADFLTEAPTVKIRPYTPADREACLALLRSNIPEHFSPAEEAELARFLDALPGPYFVVEDGGRLIASGGIAAERDGVTATLCWGIVDATRQRSGVGTELLEHRLDVFLRDNPQIRQLQTNTSQKVQGFYAKHGFIVVEVRHRAYGPDLDHVRMVRDRPPARERS
ncbi:GNAT family N-acetyltransferase [Nannocystis punicea]|uniref:GNAT family N-acetyltransferase n=1 Tax=Nannocystis punicea TaxID=2995304 RepID=A0ABY7GWL4_9BACT|nr:GNAT family N-acetyltransferase [Nannocystis poenicansa]WAS91378.1 GNAT family N-acetyltransferase [Nannocystis poenicansa]